MSGEIFLSLIFYYRRFIIKNRDQFINEQIRGREFRIISQSGEQLGVMSSADALREAQRLGLDLVLISPNAKPPVCRIMDYGKYKYEMIKKQKEAKKNQKVTELKELRFTAHIDTNDMNTKAKHALRFLEDGNKIRISVRLRGREIARPEVAVETLKQFFELINEHSVMEVVPKAEGRNVFMIVGPITKK